MINLSKWILILSLSLFLSCEDKDNYTKIHSFPEWQEERFISNTNQDLYLFVVGDFSQNLFPQTLHKPEGMPKEVPHAIKVGGLASLSSYLKVIRDRLSDKALIFGMEDGNLNEEGIKKDNLLFKSLKQLSLDSILLTKKNIPTKLNDTHENDRSGLPWLSSNILSIKTGEPIELHGTKPYQIFEKGIIKIGVIGITSYSLMNSKERNEVSGYYFQDPVTTILKYKNLLKKEGVNFLVVMFNTPQACDQGPNRRPIPLKDLPTLESHCKNQFEGKKLLERLPPETIDLLITNQKQSSGFFYRGTPILSLYEPETFISGVRLSFNGGTLDSRKSFSLPQIKVCHQIFVGTQDCLFKTGNEDFDSERMDILEKSAFGLVSPRFLGLEVKEDPIVNSILNDR